MTAGFGLDSRCGLYDRAGKRCPTTEGTPRGPPPDAAERDNIKTPCAGWTRSSPRPGWLVEGARSTGYRAGSTPSRPGGHRACLVREVAVGPRDRRWVSTAARDASATGHCPSHRHSVIVRPGLSLSFVLGVLSPQTCPGGLSPLVLGLSSIPPAGCVIHAASLAMITRTPGRYRCTNRAARPW